MLKTKNFRKYLPNPKNYYFKFCGIAEVLIEESTDLLTTGLFKIHPNTGSTATGSPSFPNPSSLTQLINLYCTSQIQILQM